MVKAVQIQRWAQVWTWNIRFKTEKPQRLQVHSLILTPCSRRNDKSLKTFLMIFGKIVMLVLVLLLYILSSPHWRLTTYPHCLVSHTNSSPYLSTAALEKTFHSANAQLCNEKYTINCLCWTWVILGELSLNGEHRLKVISWRMEVHSL